MPGGVVEGRHPSNQGRKPGPAPWGLPPPGPASVPPRGRAWASGSPPTAGRRPPRKGSIGICGAWSPEGRARAKRVHGGGDSPPGSRRPSRPLPASREGRWPPKRHSHGRPGPGGLAVPVGLASRCRWLGVVVPAGRLLGQPRSWGHAWRVKRRLTPHLGRWSRCRKGPKGGAPPQGGLAHLTGSPGPGRRCGREGRARAPPGDCPTLGG